MSSWDGPTKTDVHGRCFPDVGQGDQGSLWNAVTPVTIDPVVKAALQVHCTPRAVVEQTLRALLAGWSRRADSESYEGSWTTGASPRWRMNCPPKPAGSSAPPVLRVLDLCAGYGVWSQQLRRVAAELGFEVHITGLECREECRADLERHCDEVVICDAAEYIARTDERFDLVMGNPPFSLPDERAKRKRNDAGDLVDGSGQSRLRAYEVLVVGSRQLLADHDSRLALFVPQGWTGRCRDLAELAQLHPPIEVHNQALPVAFGADGKTDQLVYTTMVWGHPDAPARPCGLTTLPVLDPKQLRWDGHTIPGTEDA